MDTLAEQAVRQEMDRELRLVDSAIALVRRGVARTVTVVNLPLCAAVLVRAQAKARAHDLRITVAPSGGGAPCSLVVDGEDGGPGATAQPAPQSAGVSRTR